MGYAQAGFVVTGVDIRPQRRFPFRFRQMDALEALDDLSRLGQFDVIHASPPCQRYTQGAKRWQTAEGHPDLIGPTRDRLLALGLPYVIENVPTAPLYRPIILCGVMFGLGVFRHRLFELGWNHGLWPGHPDHDGQIGDGRYHTVAGHPGGSSVRDGWVGGTAAAWRKAMGIDWMTAAELAEAIPPAYTRFIGEHLMAYLRRDVIRGAA
jgi:DNA (cytosine-5)-methyltransferase 1